MKKRTLSLLTACALLVSTTPAAFAALSDFTAERSYTGQFADVPASAWYYDNVKTAYELGLVNGSSDTTYAPDDNITVAEVQTIVARIHATYHGNTIAPAEGAWYAPYVEYCMEHIDREICSMAYMLDGKTVMADTPASRTYFAYLMYAALPADEYTKINTIPDDSLLDVKNLNFTGAEERIYALYRAGILTGNDEYGTFNPDTNITRAEVAAIIARMIDPSQRVKWENPNGYTYQIETAYNVADVREMLVDNDGNLYYATNTTIYKNGKVIFDGNMPLTMQEGYNTYSYEKWYFDELATDAEHERVYALLYSWMSGSSVECLMALDLQTGEVLGTFLTSDYNLRSQYNNDTCMMRSAVVDSSGALIFWNGNFRWNFVTDPRLFMSGNASTPNTYAMHMGYANNMLMGLNEGLAVFNMNTSTIEAVPIKYDDNTSWRAVTLIASDYAGKFYSLSQKDFGLVCIDPVTREASVLVDAEHVQILDGMPLDSNTVALRCSILAAGEDCYYLFYPESACIRKLSPIS